MGGWEDREQANNSHPESALESSAASRREGRVGMGTRGQAAALLLRAKPESEDTLYPAILLPPNKNMNELKRQIKCFCTHRKRFCRMFFKVMTADES